MINNETLQKLNAIVNDPVARTEFMSQFATAASFIYETPKEVIEQMMEADSVNDRVPEGFKDAINEVLKTSGLPGSFEEVMKNRKAHRDVIGIILVNHQLIADAIAEAKEIA